MDEKPSLLFCETFSHELNEDMHLDMIGFSRPVLVTEVRVIPHGCKVHPDIRDRLGETTPSSFKLDMFCKNLAKPSATVFERLGTLDYEQGKSIQIIVNSKTVTNVVLVRGWYRNITVSLYGVFANFQPDINQVPPPPPARQIAAPPMEVQPPNMLPSSGMSPIQPGMFIPENGPPPMPPVPPMHMEPPPMGFDSPGYQRSLSPQDDDRDNRGEFQDFRRERWHDGPDERRGRMRDNERFDNRNRFRDDRRNNRRDFNDWRDNRHDNENFQGDENRETRNNRDNRDNRERFNDRKRKDETFQNENPPEPERKKPAMPTEELLEPLSGDEFEFDVPQEESKEPEKKESTKPTKKLPEKKKKETSGYEDIESDEDFMFDGYDFDEIKTDLDGAVDDTWVPVSINFNPYQCSLNPLQNIPPLVGSKFEKLVKEYKTTLAEDLIEPSQVKQLQDHIVSDSEAERDAKWVTMLEELPEIIPAAMSYLRSQASQKIKEKHFLSIISEWAVYSLNMDKARALPLAVNIRFLKAALKLTSLLANSCDEYQRMLVEMDVQGKLIDLLKTDHMASSLKLCILKALDDCTNTAFGMETMLGWNVETTKVRPISIYEDLLLYLMSKPTVRVIASIKAILQKVHFYESTATLQSICYKMSKSSVKDVEDIGVKDEPLDEGHHNNEENNKTESGGKAIELDISNKDMNDLLSSLVNIQKILDHANSIIAQSNGRSFPTTARLQEDVKQDCYPAVFRLLSSRRFLESISILVSSPLFCEPQLYVAVRDILFRLMSSYQGLLFLSSDPNTMNGLIRVLLQASDTEIDYNLNELPTLKSCMVNVDTADVCTAHHLGLLLVYYLQGLQGVDQLMETAVPDLDIIEMDSADHISLLHTLYAMTFTPIGKFSGRNNGRLSHWRKVISECNTLKRLSSKVITDRYFDLGHDAVASTFCQGENMKCLLSFLTGSEGFESKIKKSVTNRYASCLLNITLQHADGVEHFEKYATQLCTIPKKENDKTAEDNHYFLLPLEKISKLDHSAISTLLDFLRKEIDDFKLGSGNLRSVLTTLRLLKRLVKTTENDDDKQKDLQWRVAIIQMFSSNAMEVFINLLHRLGEQLLAPWKQNEPFTNNQCYIMVNVAMVTLEMVDSMLEHALMTSHSFKDSRLVTQLFVLHKILCSKPPTGLLAAMLTKLQVVIIELLMKFMRGTSKAPENEEAVKASTWYIVFKELLTFTVQKPENFVTGIVLLSELLPTPMPLCLSQDMNEEQLAKIMNNRLFAMANFSCLGAELKTMLNTVIASCCSMLQYYLRRMTCQLVDLGPAVARILMKCLCEIIDEGVTTIIKDNETIETTQQQNNKKSNNANKNKQENINKRVLSVHVNNAFSLLSYLVCQSGGKIAFLNLISTTPESPSEFPDFIQNIIKVKSKDPGPKSKTKDKEFTDINYLDRNLLPLLQSICDHEVCLDNFDGVITTQHLANSLPSVRDTKSIVRMLLEMLTEEEIPLGILIRVINILESLTDHDYGVQIIKTCLLEKDEYFSQFLERLVKEVKSKNEIPLIYNAVSIFIEFINLLNSSGPDNYMKAEVEDIKAESVEKVEEFDKDDMMDQMTDQKKEEKRSAPLQRSVFITAYMLCELLKLNSEDTSEHSLTKLEKMIEEQGKDDDELVSLSQVITTLRMIMIAGGGDKKEQESAANYGDICQEFGMLFESNTTDNIMSLGPADSLQHQFNERLTSILINNLEDERATANDWFDEPPPDGVDSDIENDTVKTDLINISEKYLPKLNFSEEVEKGFVDTTERRSKRSKALIRRGSHIEDTKRLRFDVSALNTPPSMRGVGRGANRGFTRGTFDRGGRFNRGRGFRGGFRGRGRGRGGNSDDNFRQRRQNTSRPPSMHVDDFINMEKGGETVMTHHKESAKATNSPAANNERFQNNYSTNSSPQNRWGGGNNTGGFKRPNDNSGPPGQQQRSGGFNNDYNRSNYGGNRFHNRSNSDWNNSNFSNRGGGTRDNNYQRSGGRGGGSGGYWAGGGPRQQKDDGRFYGGNNYRQNNRGRHQRTFTR